MLEGHRDQQPVENILDQRIQPVVNFDEDAVGLWHTSKALPPTAGGLGEELFEQAMGTSAQGFRPVEEEIIKMEEGSESPPSLTWGLLHNLPRRLPRTAVPRTVVLGNGYWGNPAPTRHWRVWCWGKEG